jgi:hypothetical protein
MRNGLIRLVSAIAFASTLATAGCGSSSGNGAAVGTGGNSSNGGAVGTGGNSSNGTSVTTLGDTKALNALTTVEATQLCKDTYAYFGIAIPKATTCKYKGLSFATQSSASSDSQFQQVCTQNETACLQTGAGVGTADNPGCSGISTCAATVAQYSACISDEVTAFNASLNGLPSCTSATSASTSAVWKVMIPTAPASCDSLTTECPDLTPPSPSY